MVCVRFAAFYRGYDGFGFEGFLWLFVPGMYFALKTMILEFMEVVALIYGQEEN